MVRPRQSAGFSLIELMVVVAIIGVMSAAIMPSMSDVLADHREASAAMEVLSLARKARALTLSRGTAYMLHYQKPGADDLGQIDLLQGMNGKCMQTQWSAQAFARPAETLSMAYYNPVTGNLPTATDAGRHVIVLHASIVAGTDLTDVQLCFQPNGETYIVTPTLAMQRQAETQMVTMSLTRTVDSVTHGQTREVIFPAGGSARAH